ncbi:MAG: 30S ribosomal protein S1 [Bacteroidetes bacterium]|nr:30S ribosomal protein S1 [Bacteroidota bacterium]
MSNLMRDVEGEFRAPRRGDIIEGVVMSVDKESVMVDIGTKSEGIIPAQELQRLDPKALEELKVGDSVFVYVLQPEGQEGHVILSLSRAKAERGWAVAQKYFEEGKTFEAEVVDFNRGGLIVNIEGVRGFVPMSQVVGLRHDDTAEPGPESKLAALVGQFVPLKVLEVNRRRNRLILSERLGVQERRQRRKDELLDELHEGQTRHGRVSSVCDFGAFVDVGGADGLVHLSELSWGPVQHPSHVVEVGEEVDVMVLAVDKEKKKISLSLRRCQPEPWSNVGEKYPPGALVTATITKLATFGAFARLENGVEGLIHISELSEARIAHPKNVVKEGDVVTLRVLRIDPERRRIGLSLRQVTSEERTASMPPAQELTSEDEGNVWSIGPADEEE